MQYPPSRNISRIFHLVDSGQHNRWRKLSIAIGKSTTLHRFLSSDLPLYCQRGSKHENGFSHHETKLINFTSALSTASSRCPPLWSLETNAYANKALTMLYLTSEEGFLFWKNKTDSKKLSLAGFSNNPDNADFCKMSQYYYCRYHAQKWF